MGPRLEPAPAFLLLMCTIFVVFNKPFVEISHHQEDDAKLEQMMS